MPDLGALLGREQLVQLFQGQEIEGDRAHSHGNHLQQEQCPHVVPQPKHRADQRKDRLHVIGQPGGDKIVFDLLDKAALAGVPNGLIHLAQISLVGAHPRVLVEGETRKNPNVEKNGGEKEQPIGIGKGVG